MTIPTFAPVAAPVVSLTPARARSIPRWGLYAVAAILLTIVGGVGTWRIGPRSGLSRLNLDPGQRIVFDHVMKFEDDPSSVEFVRWRPTVPASTSMYYPNADEAVGVVIRSKNKQGALAVESRIYYMKGGAVVATVEETTPSMQTFEMARLYDESVAIHNPLNDVVNGLTDRPPGKRAAPKP